MWGFHSCIVDPKSWLQFFSPTSPYPKNTLLFPSKTQHCSIHLHKITWEQKSTIQGLLPLASKKLLKDKCNFPFALSVFQGVWSSVWVLFSSKSSKCKQHQNNKEQGVHEQEKFQERLIYRLGLRNNIKEREMHGLHCSTVLIESKQILIFTTTAWRRKQSLLTQSLYFSFLLISPTWRVRWLPYQVATRFSMSLTSLLSPS